MGLLPQAQVQIFDLFKVFKALVEYQSGTKIKILKSDNGGEYVNSGFIQYCKYVGIQMQHSIPYTPQKNGVFERKNRALKEMATCMMDSKNFPPNFWAKDINCASYIQNRVPQKKLDGITPFKAWSGHKHDVSHFRIFGSKAWARIPPEKRKTMEPQSQECLFVEGIS